MAEEERADLGLRKASAESGKLEEKDLYELAYKHVNLLQHSIDKYDKTGETIRNWTIGLWTATLVAGLTQKIEGETLWLLIIVSIAIPMVMGIYDEIFKIFRQNYKVNRDILINKLQKNEIKLNDLQFPEQEDSDLIVHAIRYFWGIERPHVNLIYWTLILTSVVIALVISVSNYKLFATDSALITGPWGAGRMFCHDAIVWLLLAGFGMGLVWIIAIVVMGCLISRLMKIEKILESSKPVIKSVQDIIDERYAKGGLTRDQYMHMKDDLKKVQ